MLIGLAGQRNSGKSTFANHCVEKHGFVELAFATAVKKICNIVYGFPLEMLAGNTPETRELRMTLHEDFSNRTPIQTMQYIGTDVFRKILGEDIWIWILKREIDEIWKRDPTAKLVISDTRFSNEMQFIRQLGGRIVVLSSNEVSTDSHASETSIQEGLRHYDIRLYNNKTLGMDAYLSQIDSLFCERNMKLDRPAAMQESEKKIEQDNDISYFI
ncbi:MAG: putative deoxynucleoside monophosphate kinase [Solivirus sp.]|uniref:Putative deoxynucleoside monophosphate kinase n=1 Tax=Solivirus sp. TaxID=2487772 RepID=A0A3G5AJW2_9VIRU|nr:MAG: putative deoxynucleoside monophosphate kinase [Solivirus sp.]